MSDTVLATRGLHMAFGGLMVFDHLDFSLKQGERHAIIGPNGAGKTTFVSLITGLLRPVSGDVLLDGRVITRDPPQARVKAGIVRTFQINSLFKALNPLESVVLALCERDGRARPALRAVARESALIGEARGLLEQFGLGADALTPTQTLAYGRQRLLEIALAMALKPRVLLLDEPAAGLSTRQGHEVFEQLLRLSAGVTILFIEHDMGLVFRYADQVSVFAGGAIIVQDTPDNVRVNPRVREVYLGA